MNQVMIKESATGIVLAEGVLDETVRQIESGWYFPPESVDMTYLQITQRTYTCPYKGVCYWIDLDAPDMHAQNVAWVYQNPKRGYEAIKGYIAFNRKGSPATVAVQAETA